MLKNRRPPSTIVAAVLLAMAGGCQRELGLDVYDKAPMEALQPLGPVYKLDADGRVSELTIENKQIDEAAFDQISKLTALRGLNLYGSSFPEPALAKLQELGRLQGMRLGKTPLTDAGLEYLAKVPKLRWLGLRENPGISDGAVKQLEKARPGLKVFRRQAKGGGSKADP